MDFVQTTNRITFTTNKGETFTADVKLIGSSQAVMTIEVVNES